jgi:hypothetical protein
MWQIPITNIFWIYSTSPCCWTWWLHVLTWTLKLYSLTVSGNASFMHFAFIMIYDNLRYRFNALKSRRLFFLTANLLITSSTLRFLVLWMCNNDKFDNLSSPIVALMQFLCVAHRTEWTLARRRRHWHCYQY